MRAGCACKENFSHCTAAPHSYRQTCTLVSHWGLFKSHPGLNRLKLVNDPWRKSKITVHSCFSSILSRSYSVVSSRCCHFVQGSFNIKHSAEYVIAQSRYAYLDFEKAPIIFNRRWLVRVKNPPPSGLDPWKGPLPDLSHWSHWFVCFQWALLPTGQYLWHAITEILFPFRISAVWGDPTDLKNQ